MGGGKFAGLLVSLFRSAWDFVGYFDDVVSRGYVEDVCGIPHWGRSSEAAALRERCSVCIISVGSEGDLEPRRRYFDWFRQAGYTLPRLIHPGAQVFSDPETFGAGVIVLPGAVVDPRVVLGDNTVVSRQSLVGHDSLVGAHSFLAPGVLMNGSVRIGEQTFLGTGAIVLPQLTVGARVLVAAGACVTKDVASGSVVMGVPARERS